jgi:predicted nucleic acid-binding protein
MAEVRSETHVALMSIPLKHHFLPEFYQGGWMGADRRVTVFARPRDRLSVKRRFPSETGYERELYAVETRTEPAERQALELEVIPFDVAQAMVAGKLRSRIRSLGLSLGDRACLALAMARGLPAVTMDRGWAALDIGAEVIIARD